MRIPPIGHITLLARPWSCLRIQVAAQMQAAVQGTWCAVVCTTVMLVCVTAGAADRDRERDNSPDDVRQVPRPGIAIPAEREEALQVQLKILQQQISELQRSKDPEIRALLPDVMIFERAIRCALDHNEFFSPKDITRADVLAKEGLERARQLIVGQPQWPRQRGLVVRGFISRIDHTVQPYGLVIPEGYAFDRLAPVRCDVWFHGRGETLSEVNFLSGRMTTVGHYAPQDTIVLHPYGRYSNAFKFAGETDVLEALEDVRKRYSIDEDRISVRGFSMGGAACWQFAVHYADRWFAANPGAGFSESPRFLKSFQKETLHPRPWQEKLWSLYDCDKYAVNLTHCPTIAYSGENDVQKQAADVMEAALAEHGIRLRHIIGAGMGHKIDDVSREVIEASMASIARNGRSRVPLRIKLATHTLRYHRSHWLTLSGLHEHWKPATVEATISDHTINITSKNVRGIEIDFVPGSAPFEPGQPVTVIVNGYAAARRAMFSDGSLQLYVYYDDHNWGEGRLAWEQLHKRHGLQGPIDDAFMDSFIFVRPTGRTANERVGKWAAAELERAIVHWRRHFRGDARVVDDKDVTDELIQSANLILWGDPASNSVMDRVQDRLPIRWSQETITVGDVQYDASDHVPVLIYPNLLNPNRYMVFNSSFTYRDYAYLNNARQVPMLPDWAIVNLNTPPGNVWPGEIVAADFFDDYWRLK